MSELVRKGTIGVAASVLAFDFLTGSVAASLPEGPGRPAMTTPKESVLLEAGSFVPRMAGPPVPAAERAFIEAHLDVSRYGALLLQETAVTSTMVQAASIPQRNGR